MNAACSIGMTVGMNIGCILRAKGVESVEHRKPDQLYHFPRLSTNWLTAKRGAAPQLPFLLFHD
jgi:hypothetical protein